MDLIGASTLLEVARDKQVESYCSIQEMAEITAKMYEVNVVVREVAERNKLYPQNCK